MGRDRFQAYYRITCDHRASEGQSPDLKRSAELRPYPVPVDRDWDSRNEEE